VITGADTRLVVSRAWRFFRGRRSRLLTGTARAGLLATALGVAAMVIGMALMTGYREDLRERLIRGNAAVVVYPVTPPGAEPELPRDELLAIEGVAAVRRVGYGQGSIASASFPHGVEVTFRGVEGESALADLRGLEWSGGEGTLSPVGDGVVPLVIGGELALRLGLSDPAPLRLLALGIHDGRPQFRFRSARVAATFATGFSEFDERWVLLDREVLEDLTGEAAGLDVWEIVVPDPDAAMAAAGLARAVLGEGYLVTDWFELNRELFTALRLQQIVLFFVLGLIVLVSTFNVASGVVVLVRERLRDLGVLAALGLRPRAARRVFLAYGALVAGVGSAVGVAVGAGVSWLFTELELIRFDAEMAAIYFLSSVPFRVRWTDVALIVAFTLGIGLVSCWLPAWRGARIDPARALRYE
jgi:lipoprotein-releasing system permease protein